MGIKNILISGSKIVIVLAALLFSVSGTAKTKGSAQATAKISAGAESSDFVSISFLPGSRIQISGDSTLRKFSAVASSIDLIGNAIKKPSAAGNLPWTPLEVEMVLSVKNLKSGDETLDEHMHENLKAEKYPQMQLKLSTFGFSGSNDAKGSSITASGSLTVAGVTKPIELAATMVIEGQNLRIKGNKTVLMSDFGIEPPTMMMGTLKTRNEIEVSFDIISLLTSKQKG